MSAEGRRQQAATASLVLLVVAVPIAFYYFGVLAPHRSHMDDRYQATLSEARQAISDALDHFGRLPSYAPESVREVVGSRVKGGEACEAKIETRLDAYAAALAKTPEYEGMDVRACAAEGDGDCAEGLHLDDATSDVHLQGCIPPARNQETLEDEDGCRFQRDATARGCAQRMLTYQVPLERLVSHASLSATSAFDQFALATRSADLLYVSDGGPLESVDELGPLIESARRRSGRWQMALSETTSAEESEGSVFLDARQGSGHIIVRGVRYRMYVLPGHFPVDVDDDSEPWVLVGLVSEERFNAESFASSRSQFLISATLLVSMFLAWPWLRLFLMSRHEAISRRHVLALAASLMLIAALSAMLLTDETITSRDAAQRTLRARSLAEEIDRRVRAHVRASTDLLEGVGNAICADDEARRTFWSANTGAAYDEAPASLCDDPLSADQWRQGVPPVNEVERPHRLADVTHQPPFETAFLLDDQGHQVGCWGTFRGRGRTPLRVPDRPYFQEIQAGRGFRPRWLDGRTVYVERIRTRTQGLLSTAIAMPTDTMVTCADTKSLAEVAVLTGPSHVLTDPILPAGFGYLVVGPDGGVLFHSDDRRSLVEDFFAETHTTPEIVEHIRARREGTFDAPYHGSGNHRFHLRPIEGLPWTIVVFEELSVFDSLRVTSLNLAGVGTLIYVGVFAGLLALLGIGVGERLDRAVWPSEERTVLYWRLSVWNLLVYLVCVTLMCGRISAAGHLALAVAGVLLGGGVAAMAFLRSTVDQHDRGPEPSSGGGRSRNPLGVLYELHQEGERVLLPGIGFLASAVGAVLLVGGALELWASRCGTDQAFSPWAQIGLGVVLSAGVTWLASRVAWHPVRTPTRAWSPSWSLVAHPIMIVTLIGTTVVMPAPVLLSDAREFLDRELTHMGQREAAHRFLHMSESLYGRLEKLVEPARVAPADDWAKGLALTPSRTHSPGKPEGADARANAAQWMHDVRCGSAYAATLLSPDIHDPRHFVHDVETCAGIQIEPAGDLAVMDMTPSCQQVCSTQGLEHADERHIVEITGLGDWAPVTRRARLASLASREAPDGSECWCTEPEGDASPVFVRRAPARTVEALRDGRPEAAALLVAGGRWDQQCFTRSVSMAKPGRLIGIAVAGFALVFLLTWRLTSAAFQARHVPSGRPDPWRPPSSTVDPDDAPVPATRLLLLDTPTHGLKRLGLHASQIAFHDLDLALLDADTRAETIAKLAALDTEGPILVTSVADPMDLFPQEAWLLDEDEDPRHRLTRDQRATLDAFRDTLVPRRVAFHAAEPPAPEPGAEPQARQRASVLQLLWQECQWNGMLQPLYRQLAAEFERSAGRHTHASVIDVIERRAEPIYRRVWRTLPRADRLALIQVAAGGFLLERNRAVTRRLLRRGLLVADPVPRLPSEAFRQFVLDAEPAGKVAAWKGAASRSPWTVVRVPIAVALVVLVMFVAYLEREVFDMATALIPAVAAGVTATLNAFSRMRLFAAKGGGPSGPSA